MTRLLDRSLLRSSRWVGLYITCLSCGSSSGSGLFHDGPSSNSDRGGATAGAGARSSSGGSGASVSRDAGGMQSIGDAGAESDPGVSSGGTSSAGGRTTTGPADESPPTDSAAGGSGGSSESPEQAGSSNGAKPNVSPSAGASNSASQGGQSSAGQPGTGQGGAGLGGAASAGATGSAGSGQTGDGGSGASGNTAGAASGGSSGSFGGSVAGGTAAGGSSTAGSAAGGTAAGGTAAAGAAGSPANCSSRGEVCNGLDDNCNSMIDEGDTCPESCRGLQLLGHGYMYCASALGAEASSRICKDEGMHLVWLESRAENQSLLDAVSGLSSSSPPESIRIGASDADDEGNWRWQGGNAFWRGDASGSEVRDAYVNWGRGEPDNSRADGPGEDCSTMSVTGRRDAGTWRDVSCNSTFPFVCEAE